MELTPEQEAELAKRYEDARPDKTQTLLLQQANVIRDNYLAELAAKAVPTKTVSAKSTTEGGA